MSQAVLITKENAAFREPAFVLKDSIGSDIDLEHTSDAMARFAKHLQSRRPKIVIFDKDGTLADCSSSFRRWTHHMVGKIQENYISDSGSSSFEDLLVDFYQRIGWDAAKDDVTPSAPLAAGTWEEITDILFSFLSAHQNQLKCQVSIGLALEWNRDLGELHGNDPPVIDDLSEMLSTCRRMGYVVAICTSDDRAGTNSATTAWGVGDLVDVSVCGDEVAEAKPSAVPLHDVCKLARELKGEEFLPQDCIVVGDTTADTGMAKASKAGLCVGVLTGSGTTEQLMDTGAHLVLPSVGQIPALLETLERISKESQESQ